MKVSIVAAFALFAAASLHAQTATAPADFTYAMPLPGSWTYAPATGGSEAVFLDQAARPQLILHCTRATRRITIAKPAAAASPLLLVWTSSLSRNVPASFDPATARISVALAAFDPLLDAMAFSRGRIAVGVSGSPALVVPAWPDFARVIEDCRA